MLYLERLSRPIVPWHYRPAHRSNRSHSSNPSRPSHPSYYSHPSPYPHPVLTLLIHLTLTHLPFTHPSYLLLVPRILYSPFSFISPSLILYSSFLSFTRPTHHVLTLLIHLTLTHSNDPSYPLLILLFFLNYPQSSSFSPFSFVQWMILIVWMKRIRSMRMKMRRMRMLRRNSLGWDGRKFKNILRRMKRIRRMNTEWVMG